MVADVSKDRLVPFDSKLAFGVGQFAEGLMNTAMAAFILFYYNQVLGLPGTLAGAALFIALMFDAVSDPLAGSLSDNFKSKLGRRHPFMYASALPLGLAFFGLFAPPTGLGDWGLFAWLAVFAVLTRMAMTLYHVPHLALGAEMTENFNERTRVVAFRQFFSALGVLAAWYVGPGWFFADDRGGRVAIDNYVPFALTLAVLMVATIWYSAYGTQKEIPSCRHRHRSPSGTRSRKRSSICARRFGTVPSGGCFSAYWSCSSWRGSTVRSTYTYFSISGISRATRCWACRWRALADS